MNEAKKITDMTPEGLGKTAREGRGGIYDEALAELVLRAKVLNTIDQPACQACPTGVCGRGEPDCMLKLIAHYRAHPEKLDA